MKNKNSYLYVRTDDRTSFCFSVRAYIIRFFFFFLQTGSQPNCAHFFLGYNIIRSAGETKFE